jgi:hypothetical protein
MTEYLRRIAKRSIAVHGLYKLARDFSSLPKSKLTKIEQLAALIKCLPNTMVTMPRLCDVYDMVVELNRSAVPGDIVECGVWNGGCMALMMIANRRHRGPQRLFHLFDSFQGLPQPSKKDVDVMGNYLRDHEADTLDGGSGELSAIGACVGLGQREVEAYLVDQLELPGRDMVFHVGWFQETVPVAKIDRIALLRLDGDWYESTKICIEGFYSKVVSGGYVVIDDYGTFAGCRQAIHEFLDSNGLKPTLRMSDNGCAYFRKDS